MDSSYLVGQRGPVSVRRIRLLVLALSMAALLGLNFAQGPQSASALNFTKEQPSTSALNFTREQGAATDSAFGGDGTDTTEDTLKKNKKL